MLYPWLDWHRASLTAWLKASTPGGSRRRRWRVCCIRRASCSSAHAGGRERQRAAARAGRGRGRAIPGPGRGHLGDPFVRLVRLRRPGPQRQRFVVLAPHSGYATAVISPLVTALLAMGEVVISDWVDARLAPAAAGGFGLARADRGRPRGRHAPGRPGPSRGASPSRGQRCWRSRPCWRCAHRSCGRRASSSSVASSTHARRQPLSSRCWRNGRATCWPPA